jgi:polysaccharide pyruvyl transferase WcaK-like protein
MRRKPVNELSRNRKNRGYESNKASQEIQNEILEQYRRIKKSLSTIDPLDVEYKDLITMILKIENQVRTFSIEKTDEMKYDEIVEEEGEIVGRNKRKGIE